MEISIDSSHLSRYMRDILSLTADADPELLVVASRQMAEEISNRSDGSISYADFVHIFKYRL